MAGVQTATGEVDAADLGTTLMHEHVFIVDPEIHANYPGTFDEDAAVADATRQLTELAGLGVDTIVDLTTLGMGRNVPLVQRVAQQVPVRIVVATGLYTYDELPHYFGFRGASGGTKLMVELFRRDVQDGIADTGVRAGIIKCATDRKGVTEGVELSLRAAARAHRLTGAPISTHTHARSEQGLAQQRLFTEEGVDLSRVVIGHSGDTTDLGYLQKLMDAGSTTGMDRFGVDTLLDFDQRVQVVADLCARGYAGRMVLSHDTACHSTWNSSKVPQLLPNWHFRHLHDDVLPALRERGVDEQAITTMLVDNPRRILEAHEPY